MSVFAATLSLFGDLIEKGFRAEKLRDRSSAVDLFWGGWLLSTG